MGYSHFLTDKLVDKEFLSPPTVYFQNGSYLSSFDEYLHLGKVFELTDKIAALEDKIKEEKSHPGRLSDWLVITGDGQHQGQCLGVYRYDAEQDYHKQVTTEDNAKPREAFIGNIYGYSSSGYRVRKSVGHIWQQNCHNLSPF